MRGISNLLSLNQDLFSSDLVHFLPALLIPLCELYCYNFFVVFLQLLFEKNCYTWQSCSVFSHTQLLISVF